MMFFRPSPHRELESRLGHRFRKVALLDTALLHPSAPNERATAGGAGPQTNQRLEFLGDAVLGLLAAELLYERYAGADEGDLTRARSAMCSTRALAQVAAALDLGASLTLGRGEENNGGRTRESNLADAMEAVLGAVYLDGGHRAVQKVFLLHFAALAGDSPAAPATQDNPKGRLQEIVQRQHRVSPSYHLVSSEGPAHARTFVVEVRIRDRVLARASGPSKRAAETAAAELTLEQVDENESG